MNSSFMISGLPIILEFAPPDRRPTYIGINNMLISSLTILYLGVIDPRKRQIHTEIEG